MHLLDEGLGLVSEAEVQRQEQIWADVCRLDLPLSPRLTAVVVHRSTGLTFREIGERFGHSGERVRQMYHLAQRRLRAFQYGPCDLTSVHAWLVQMNLQSVVVPLPEIEARGGPRPFNALSPRSQNLLSAMEVDSFEELSKYTERQLLKTRNFGRKSLRELREALHAHGLSFKKEVLPVYSHSFLPGKVWVALWSHRHGTDVAVFDHEATEEEAIAVFSEASGEDYEGAASGEYVEIRGPLPINSGEEGCP